LWQSCCRLLWRRRVLRQQTADKKERYPKLRPIFNILGESEKWVGRMHATGLLKEDRFQEIFTNYIDVLERHFDELKGTYLPPEQGAGGASRASPG
jgi:hypothetical protein